MAGRNRLKYLSSLKIKKYRLQYRQFIIEGDKIVRDVLKESIRIRQLVATGDWLRSAPAGLREKAGEILETDYRDIERISSLESPPPVLAVMDMEDPVLDFRELSESCTIALDTIQDPGNLGTIIRTADWFGIRHIICNEGCVDFYNPKVVQASMGALFHVKLYLTGIAELIKEIPGEDYPVYGAFTEGMPVSELPHLKRGMFIFGNESRGISKGLFPVIHTRITIPPGNPGRRHVESLNVASAVAVVCSRISDV